MRCKRKAWLDLNGNKALRNWSPQKSLQIVQEFNNFKKFTGGDLYKGIKACERGYKGVIGYKIETKIIGDFDIEVNPSILIKIKGNSIWGDYKYIPAVSKLGKRTTIEHLLDLALCAIVLEKTQLSQVDYGLVIYNSKNKIETEKIYINKRLRQKAIDVYSELNQIIRKNIPEITNNRKKCSACSWQKFCDKEATINGYLTDIDGIGSKTSLLLKNIGINNIKQLASADHLNLFARLSKYQENNLEKVSKIINQSKAFLSGIPIKINHENIKLKNLKTKNSGFFIFDIESNPDENHDFLYGFISLNNIKNIEEANYEAILNLKHIESSILFEKICLKINSQKDWPILHYGETEKIAILKLGKKYGLSLIEIKNLEERFIDLHSLVRDTWILPLKNYSLKTVANWTGFIWRQKNVSGSRALFWWVQYKNTSNNLFLEKIIKYNNDDCLATLYIAKWLLEN